MKLRAPSTENLTMTENFKMLTTEDYTKDEIRSNVYTVQLEGHTPRKGCVCAACLVTGPEKVHTRRLRRCL